jgi:hypothetical protein
MANIDALLPDLMPYCPGVPYSQAVRALRDATIKLCARSLIHIYFDPGSSPAANTTQFTVTPPSNTALVRVMELFVDKRRVDPVPPQQLSRYFPNDWPLADAGYPRGWYQDGATTVRVVPKTDATYAFSALIALRPSDAATVIDDFLFQDWATEIVNGALASLLAIPRQPWTDPKEASRYEKMATAGINNAIIEANRGRANALLGVQLPSRP